MENPCPFTRGAGFLDLLFSFHAGEGRENQGVSGGGGILVEGERNKDRKRVNM